ncbi:MAG TPA: TlpA disulfide reductase family protein [Acidimicrobiales bacterium]
MDPEPEEGVALVPPRSGPRLALLIGGTVVATILILVGILSLLGQGPAGERNRLVGTKAPRFSLPGVVGGAVRAPWVSHDAAVVLFFADWCAPCHQELPGLARVAGNGSFGRVRVIGIDSDHSPGVASAFLRASGVHFPVGHDPNVVIASQLVPSGFPATVFVSANGRITRIDYGVLSPAALRAGIVALQ